ncbi:MAG: endonuclease III [Ignavibacteriae bacterium]|nr:endonuclease III [Ignavibacteriota bacterium]
MHDRTREIIRRLKRAYPDALTALHHSNPLELLISTILSAQCTDARVNIVTKDLFKRYRSANYYSTTDVKELEGFIRSTGFFHAKAKNIIGCCKGLMARHNGKVPDTMEDLLQLPGVGRKTANVVLGSAFGKTVGIVVDTHVKRLSGRLGLSKKSDPEKIEQDLMPLVPRKDWIVFPHLFIWHGRKICQARKPRCSECPVNDLCPSANKFAST